MKDILSICVIALLVFCGLNSQAQFNKPCDPKATKETQILYNSMQRLTGPSIMFGHHDDAGYGVNWRLQDDSSDVKAVTGSYPAVYGWDLAKLSDG